MRFDVHIKKIQFIGRNFLLKKLLSDVIIYDVH